MIVFQFLIFEMIHFLALLSINLIKFTIKSTISFTLNNLYLVTMPYSMFFVIQSFCNNIVLDES